jgi:hypothetical protein
MASPGVDDIQILEDYDDPNYVPTTQEVEAYALWLGADISDQAGRKLLWIAKKALTAGLPEGWKAWYVHANPAANPPFCASGMRTG